jgi:hypothetical protein
VLAVSEIVRIHDRANVRFFHRGFEDRQIDFPHGALVDDRISAVAVKLRVVAHEMLDGGGDTLALNSLDVSDGDPRPEKRIFAKVFEVTPI